ncbi:MAG TPA: hypothetical protein VD968_03285 [Pyrinomonadaceae bacterium]|nr:hypothetical protein [Pyrinomonadaceae bacterium]
MRKRIILVCTMAMTVVAIMVLARAQDIGPVTLRERALVTGNYVKIASASQTPMFQDLDQLGAASTLIIKGTVRENISKLSADGNFISTNYTVVVDQVFKGSLVTVNDSITVSIPGGKVGFRGRTPDKPAFAEVKAPWFKRMEDGKQYYLFLSPDRPAPTTQNIPNPSGLVPFLPTGGPQGVFEVAGGVVKTHSGRPLDPVRAYNNAAVSSFNQQVVVAAQPHSPTVLVPVDH